MADIIAQVGEIYKGWEIIGIREGLWGGRYYKLKCKCGYEYEYLETNLLKKYGDQGCKKCTDISRRMFKKGDLVGNYEIMDSGSKNIKNEFIYKFKCLTCSIETFSVANKRISRPGCNNCLKKNHTTLKVQVGNIFNSWTVIKRVKNKSGNILFLCMCKCGITRYLLASSLIRQESTACALCSGKRYGHPKRFDDIQYSKPPKLTEYNNPYLNFCITPKTMDEIIEHFGLILDEIQDILMDLMLEGKIEQNKELLWETI